MKRVFVSGHMHVTDAEFEKHYQPKIDALLAAEGGTHFLVGDAPGFDTKVQAVLADSGAKVTVYHMKAAARNNVGDFETVGGFETAEARDEAMTQASEADLAWVRSGRWESGVGTNIRRRKKLTGMAEHSEADDADNAAFNKAWGADDAKDGADDEDEDEADEYSDQ